MCYFPSPLTEAFAGLRRAVEADAQSGALEAAIHALVLRLLAQLERLVAAWSRQQHAPRRAAPLPPYSRHRGDAGLWCGRTGGPYSLQYRVIARSPSSRRIGPGRLHRTRALLRSLLRTLARTLARAPPAIAA